MGLDRDGATRSGRVDNNFTSRVSLNSDCPIASGGAKDDQWRGPGTGDSSAERTMPNHPSAEYSSAEYSSAEYSSAERPSAGGSSAEYPSVESGAGG